MIGIGTAVIVTFVITTVWQIWATRKIRANQQMMAGALIKELEEAAKKLGFSSLEEYYRRTKGDDYAETTVINIRNFMDSFTVRGPGK